MNGVQELLACQIANWYPRFQAVTFKTVLLPLPQPVLDWLVSDGLHLPADSQAFAKRGELDPYATEEDYQDWLSEDGSASQGGGSSNGSSNGSSAAAQEPPPELAQVLRQVQAAIDELGGKVVPKLSWSCPKDAVWMSPTSSLCCTNADEVLLLLKSSDRVAHDIGSALEEAQAAAAAARGAEEAAGATAGAAAGAAAGSAAAGTPHAVQHCLALRRWYDLQPGREFRCFVAGQRLAGVCQRDLTQCFEFLRAERVELAAAIQAFHAKHVRGRFPQPNYTYDVYAAASGAVRLVDFNPAGGTTAPLLFAWEELLPATGEGAGAAAEAAAAAGAMEEAASVHRMAHAGSGCQAGACQSCSPQQPAQAGTAAVSVVSTASAAPAAESECGPSYLEQLQRVQALSLAGQQRQQQQQAACSATAGPSTDQPAPAAPAAAAPAAAGGFDFRIIDEPVAMRPHTLAYGVPFDFVDSSEGSAIDRLMQQQRQQTQQGEAGGGGGSGGVGADELWAALQQQAAGRGGAAS